MVDSRPPNIAMLASRIRAGELTPTELVESCLARIEELDPRIDAWRLVDTEGALAAAKSLTAEARAGRLRGPLHGIPVGIKDVIDVQGLPTRAGCRARQDAAPASADAAVVARLRAAGAVVLGKTHTTDMAFYDPAPTRNPYHPDHTPGGSSSGSAAAVAAGMVPLTLGTQTNASVCRPAAYCGIAGFKPTGRGVPAEGLIPLAPSFDTIGFFGRTIADAGAGYFAAVGAGAAEPAGGPGALRIGAVADPLYDRTAPAVRSFTERVAGLLTNTGHRVERVPSPVPFERLIEAHGIVMAREAAMCHGELVEREGARLGRRFRELVEEGLRIPADRYESAQRALADARAAAWRAFASYDVLLLPPVSGPAPAGLGSTGDPSFTTAWTVFGGPLAVLPGALDDQGLPLAVMLATPPGTDARLLEVAGRVEAFLTPLPPPALAAHAAR